MEQKIIAIYCLEDKMVKQSSSNDDVHVVISKVDVFTIRNLAISDFNGNYCEVNHYLNKSRREWFKSIDYSCFIRQINSLYESIEEIFENLSTLFIKISSTQIFAIDLLPVKLRHVQSEKCSNLLNDPELKGYNASKKWYFYGFKVHMVTTTDKEPAQCFISMERATDVKIAHCLFPQVHVRSIGISNKRYASKELKAIRAKHGVYFQRIYRPNHEAEDREYFTKRKLCKKIKTAFSTIKAKFGEFLKATSINGFLTNLKLFMAAYFFKIPEHKQNLLLSYYLN